MKMGRNGGKPGGQSILIKSIQRKAIQVTAFIGEKIQIAFISDKRPNIDFQHMDVRHRNVNKTMVKRIIIRNPSVAQHPGIPFLIGMNDKVSSEIVIANNLSGVF